MPMLIENAGGAPPSAPGTAPNVDVASSFHRVTALASATYGCGRCAGHPESAQEPPDCQL